VSLRNASHSNFNIIPSNGEPGSFWENRGDRFHCGVDMYAPLGFKVVAIEDGEVISVGKFTATGLITYWNNTNYILVKNSNGLYYKYAEIHKVQVSENQLIKAGDVIAEVAQVLNADNINSSSPEYIQKLKNKNTSMLHFEVYSKDPIITHKNYLAGNWFGKEKPENLLDPKLFINA
jgi:murein DD-endopeptidase MepM/ murein hydrolase activator NlpD